MAPSRAQFGHKTLSELKLKFMVHLIQNSFLIFYKMCILETQNKLWTYNSIKTKTQINSGFQKLINSTPKSKRWRRKKALQKQHEQGKLTARERIAYLLDNDDEAIEIAAFAGHEMYEEHGGCPSAGVVVKLVKFQVNNASL